MEIATFTELVAQLGFPIACVIVLGLFCWFVIKWILTDSKEREDRLNVQLGKCQEVNEKAIETIAKYASSLSDIETDVKEIKTDLTVIKTKLE